MSASTQSAVSKRISALENELGARLFERTGRGATLTDAGRVLLPRAEALTSEADGPPICWRTTAAHRGAPFVSRCSRRSPGRWSAS
ncbi:MAG: LysR family transcriptional regulator [Betaproteobacteria bacterium]|nr:LysR family transcriptional regulator [Betaproteobacteria bacterium]